MKRIAISIILVALCVPVVFALPDFGNVGLNGLTEAQKQQLAAGKIVFATVGSIAKSDSELIYAAIVFNRPVEETWKLISRTEDQNKYLSSIDDLKIIRKGGPTDNIEFSVSAGPFTKTYRVIHRFSPEKKGFEWGLDPTFDNDLQKLTGFWRFYDFGDGRTLARYGSNVSIRGVPGWVESLFKKKGITEALGQVKQYVDSGGTWRCRR
ncbi:MAG: SRPBCC family protein [Spirochaetes bacterium]|nr:SRPBCC family protein [Spirochaetota bacterium]